MLHVETGLCWLFASTDKGQTAIHSQYHRRDRRCTRKERARSGKWFVRYVAQWPDRGGKQGRATFSVALYGERQAFGLAVLFRQAGLRALKSSLR